MTQNPRQAPQPTMFNVSLDISPMEEDKDLAYPSGSDLDLSFTSCASAATTTTFASSSARSSLARSSLTLSFNESRISSTTSPSTSVPNLHTRPHRQCDPHWSAIKTATNLSSDGTLHLRHLKLLRHVGSGNLGRVFLCRLRDNDHANFALKVVDRDSLSSKKISHIETEAQILSMLDHPFLPTLYTHLQVSHYTCLLIDYCPNGDLNSLLHKQPGNRLPIESVKFYAAEVLVALEYLHALGIVYRDLKPENILIRENGHIMLSDFDLCFNADVVPKLENKSQSYKLGSTENRSWNCFGDRRMAKEVVTEFVAEPTAAFSRCCVGTHEYLAPELVSGNGHGNGVDWWAFGILVYELLYGKTPFRGGSKESTLRNIASTREVRFEREEDGEGMSEVRDLIEKLLVKDPRKRLGCTRGAADIKSHPFFNGIKWPLILTYRPPEVRGIAVKKARTQLIHVTEMVSSKRRSWWRKGLRYFMKNNKHKLNSNHNYYRYIDNKVGKHA